MDRFGGGSEGYVEREDEDFRFGSGIREEEPSRRGWERWEKRREMSRFDEFHMRKNWRERIKRMFKLLLLASLTSCMPRLRSIRLILSAERFANVPVGYSTREANIAGCPANDNFSIVLAKGEVVIVRKRPES